MVDDCDARGQFRWQYTVQRVALCNIDAIERSQLRMKDNLAALEALGITLPSTAYIIGVVIFGIVGYVVYRYGKKMSLQATKWIGIAMMLYPYAVSTTWLLYLVGAGLCVGAYLSTQSERAP